VILGSRDTGDGAQRRGRNRQDDADKGEPCGHRKPTGKEVFTFAPSAEASRGVLRKEGFANAETVERLTNRPENAGAVTESGALGG
jgi:hypothetical protein